MSNITGLFHLLGILNKLGRLAELLYGVSIYSGLFTQFLIKTSVQAGAVLMPLAMFLLSLKSIRVL